MKIAVIGAGHVGAALAKSWAEEGHRVVVGARNPQDEKYNRLAEEHEHISVKGIREAAEESEVILVATPASVIEDVAGQLGQTGEKVIIDATNSVFSKPERFANGSEALRSICRNDHVVKCFNATGYENMINPRYGETTADMFMAGNSEKGKKTALKLAADAGFEQTYDFGGDDKIALLEQFAMAWINLAIMQKNGRDLAFKILRR